MDPITLVVTAIALGASAGLNETAASAVKDGYATLKAVLGRRQVDVTNVEQAPESLSERVALRETLAERSNVVDEEVLAAARHLTEAVAEHDAAVGRIVGVDLADIQAEFLRVGSVASSGDGIRVRTARLSGGLSIDRVEAGFEEEGGPSAR